MSPIELFGVTALIALAVLAAVLVAVLMRDARSWDGAATGDADDEAIDADLTLHGVRHG